jgi:thioesterase domain-containing protein
MVYEVGPGDKRLVAFIVPRQGQAFEWGALRQQLSQKLPEHMLPSLFMPVAALPRTPNGKIDRKSLPQPDFGLQAAADELPRNDTEGALVELWKETLSVSTVGLHDRFFDLGGNSLLAGTLLARMSRQFGRDYPLSILAEYDTVQKMAALLEDPRSGHTRTLVPVKADGTRPPLFVVPGGFGDALYLRHLARHIDPEQPLYGLQAGVVDGQAEDLPSVGDIAASYISEVGRVLPAGPYFIAGHSFGGYVALEMARQLRASGQIVALVGLLDTYPPGPRQQARWTDRLSLHWDNLRGRDWQGRIGYLRERVLDFLPRLLKYRRLAKWLGLNRRGREYRIFVSRSARYTYLPAPYPGRAILVKAMERDWYVHWDPMETWPRFVPDLQVFEVEGTHRQIMFEPYIQQVARHLNLAIRQVLSGSPPLECQREAEPATRED